jgi:hypothetical protein
MTHQSDVVNFVTEFKVNIAQLAARLCQDIGCTYSATVLQNVTENGDGPQ